MSYLPPSAAPAPRQSSHSFVDRIVGSIKLSRPIYDEVRRDPSAMMQAAGIVVVTGLLSGISQFASVRGDTIDLGDGDTYEVTNSVFGPLVSGIGVALVSLVFWVVSAIAIRFVATKILGSPEVDIQWQEVARPLGFASAPTLLLILTPIPIVGYLIASVLWIWGLATNIVAMSETFRVSKWRAFFILVLSSIALAIVLSVLVCVCILAALAVF